MKSNYLEIKETLAGQRLEFPCQRLKQTADKVVVLYRLSKQRTVEDLTLPVNTISLGYFWSNRAYNVYHWLTPEGTTIGLYCNICDQTQITSQHVHWRDLVVDVLLLPDGRHQVLDVDEVPAGLSLTLRRSIREARQNLVANRQTLFSEIQNSSKDWWPVVQKT